MARTQRPTNKPPLTADLIIATAVAMADAHGTDQLSMRNLAAGLATGAMSLYNHVANKDELLDLMVDQVAGEIDMPHPDTDWKSAARHLATSTHTVLLRHPWAGALWPARWPGPKRLRLMETLLAVLASADLPDDVADLGFHAIINHVQGFTQQQLAYAATYSTNDSMNRSTHTANDGDGHEPLRRTVDLADFPLLVDHMRFHGEGHHQHDGFTFVLDLILDGLDRSGRR